MDLLLTNNLIFSSIFPCDNDSTNNMFRRAATKLGIAAYDRRVQTVSEAHKSILSNVGRRHIKGPENSVVVDVPGDGNCLFYCLAATLVGFIDEEKVSNKNKTCHALKNNIYHNRANLKLKQHLL